MGTRSMIGIENEDKSITAIYCHWDGYPTYNGKMLLHHYQDEGKISAMIDLGDMSDLKEEIGVQHPFDYYGWDRDPDKKDQLDPAWDKMSTFYGRDRGETGVEPKHYKNRKEFNQGADNHNAEFMYIFTKAKRWVWSPVRYKREPKPVAERRWVDDTEKFVLIDPRWRALKESDVTEKESAGV